MLLGWLRSGWICVSEAATLGVRPCVVDFGGRSVLSETCATILSVARRSRGTGSLSVRRDARGLESWYGQWWVGGRRVTRKLGRKREAGTRSGLTRSQAERELQRAIDRHLATPIERDVTVEDAGERLLEHLGSLGRKRSTLGEYESFLRVHLSPFFGRRPLERIETAEVEAFIAAKRREGKAAKSIVNYLGLLHSIFVFAEKRGLATGNPVKLVDKPERQVSDPDIRFLDEAELEALLAAVWDDAKGPTERCLFLTAAMTGLRQGELLGLRWRDVDWPAARVRVRQSYVRGEFGAPKSRRSSRSVPLADRVAGELERHFQRSAFQADEDLVFCHPGSGTPLDRSRLLTRFKATAGRAGIREVRFHDLRHTFGTRMAAAGVALRTLQEWMGHRDFKTTLIYADYQPSAGEANLVERAFGQGAKRGAKLSESAATSGDRIPLDQAESDLS
jgi:integrase